MTCFEQSQELDTTLSYVRTYLYLTCTTTHRVCLLQWYILCALYLTSSIFAVIIIIFLLDNDSPDARAVSSSSDKAGLATAYRQDYSSEEPTAEHVDTSCSWSMLFATVYQWRDINQLLIIPLSIYSGLQQAFFFGDIAQVCRHNIHIYV